MRGTILVHLVWDRAMVLRSDLSSRGRGRRRATAPLTSPSSGTAPPLPMKPPRDLRALGVVPLSWLTPDLHHVAALEVVM